MKKNKLIHKVKGAGERLLSLLYPDICPFCGKVLGKAEKGHICTACQFRLPYIYEPRCKKCGKPVMKENQEYCWDCQHHKHFYDRGFSVWEHQPVVADAIYQFKYHNRRIYSRFFAREMVKSYRSIIQKWDIDLIVPIPISKNRRRKRGYNQAELLAREISKETGIPYVANSFVRYKDTSPQKMLDVKERKKNLRNAFAWKGRRRPPENILLIDDIYTTGNTIDSAAITLKKAGVKKVYFLTISIGQGY